MKKYIPETRRELIKLVNNVRINLGDIDVSNITDMTDIFFDTVRRDFSGIEDWDVSNVKNMSFMFENSKFNGDISKWNISNVKNTSGMFVDSQFNGDISKWDVSNVKNMSYMFENSKFNGDLSSWNLNKDVIIDDDTLNTIKGVSKGRIE